MTRGGKEGRACRAESELFSKDAVRVNGGRKGERPSVWTSVTNHLLQPVLLAIPPSDKSPRESSKTNETEYEVRITANRSACA